MVSILITAGPTREHLDDVRYLSNGSSGRMGFALASAAIAVGCQPTLVLGPTELQPPSGCAVVRVVSALEMQAAAERAFAGCDVAIAAAAFVLYWAARALHRVVKLGDCGGVSLEGLMRGCGATRSCVGPAAAVAARPVAAADAARAGGR